MKSFLQFLSEGEGRWTPLISGDLQNILDRIKDTKLVDPSGNPLQLYRGIKGPYNPDFSSAREGYFGPGVYTSPDINIASGYLPRETVITKPKAWWNPFSKESIGQVLSPQGVLLKGVANIENPLKLQYGEDLGRKLGLASTLLPSNVPWKEQMDALSKAFKSRGIDAIVGQDKYTSGRPIPIVNITEPEKFIPVAEYSPPKSNLPIKARKGSIDTEMLKGFGTAALSALGGAMAAGAEAGASVAGVYSTPEPKTRMQGEKTYNTDVGLAFNFNPDSGDVEADPAGMKAVRERQKRGQSFPTMYPDK